MKEIKYNQIIKIVLIITLIPLIISSVYASPYLDQAKGVVEDYYKFTKEKDIDSYMELFDQNYLNEMYGTNNKELFEEVFSYFDLSNYEIDFQQYTEGPDSLSLFFHLEADSTLEGEPQKIDQDLLAIFSKINDELKLRYIMLQSVYREVMITESIYQNLMKSSIEDEIDLVEEAIEAGLITEDEIEDSMTERESSFRLRHLFIIIIIGAIIFFVYVKRKVIIENKDVNKTFNNLVTKAKPTMNNVAEKTKKTYNEKIVPNSKKFMAKTKKTYNEKIVPKAKEYNKKLKKYSKDLKDKVEGNKDKKQ